MKQSENKYLQESGEARESSFAKECQEQAVRQKYNEDDLKLLALIDFAMSAVDDMEKGEESYRKFISSLGER